MNTLYTCPICQIGYCQPHTTTFTSIHRGHFVSANDMTTYICDVCDYKRFDSVEVIKLRSLLGRQYPLKSRKSERNHNHPPALDIGDVLAGLPKAKL